MKHKHCDLIKAWAEGAQIQVETTRGWKDFKTGQQPAWDVSFEYRIKPETKKYRVSLHNIEGDFFTTISNTKGEASNREEYISFVKWLTDWIEYEA